MDRKWDDIDDLDTFVHRKPKIDNWTPTSIEIKRDEMIAKQSNPSARLWATIHSQIDSNSKTNGIWAPLSSIYFRFRNFRGQSTTKQANDNRSFGLNKSRLLIRLKWTQKTTHPRIPWFLAIPRSDSLWEMNWKVLLLNGSQQRAAVEMSPRRKLVYKES